MLNTSAKKEQNPITESSTIVIVGGGNVGLSFALLLSYYGIKCTLLEKTLYPIINPDDDVNRSKYLDSRNTALSRRTVQIYEEIGLWDELKSHACRIDEVHISEVGSFGNAQLKKEEEGLESFGYVMENAWLGRKLLLAAKNSELITLLDGMEVTEVNQSNRVTVTYLDKGRSSECNNELQADMLVACDGRDSIIRNILNIDTKIHDYEQSAIVGVVTTDKPHNNVGIERFSSVGPLAVLPLTDATHDAKVSYRRSVVWICPKGEEQRYLDDDEYFLQTIQDTFGLRAGKFLQAGRRGMYPLVKVLAKQQVHGRCVIMGNAAHTLHPVAGQGFNLCMRDAEKLAMMLSDQVENDSLTTSALLVKYKQARIKDQKRVIRFCDAVVYGFTHPHPVIKFSRNLGLLIFDKVPNIKPLVATYAMGLKS